ncbi:MAG: hypothetical protein KGO96_07410 [Elusimicrobia bacterium]|nr:hypothetical protein [Elusimicrobiota bacterium]
MKSHGIPFELGGDFPLNPDFQQVLYAHLTEGQILEAFFGVEGASKDPMLAYRRDDYWLQWAQLMASKTQTDQQMLMQQQQMAAQQQAQAQPQLNTNIPDVQSGVDQLLGALGKSEGGSPDRKKMQLQHDLIVRSIMDKWEQRSKEALEKIKKITKDSVKPKKSP